MKTRIGWILMLMVSFTSVSAFAQEAREEEQKAPQEEVAAVDDVQDETCVDTEE